MSVDALFNASMALRRRIVDATLDQGSAVAVHVGSPVAAEVGDAAVSLTLFDVHPSVALRNTPRFSPPPSAGPVTGPAALIESVALDLRYLIVCYRKKALGNNEAGTFPTELAMLGRIIAALHSDPVLSIAAEADANAGQEEKDAALAEQTVRLSAEPYGLDEWNRLWAMFPDSAFRTSIVYLVTPVYVSAAASALYPRVRSRRLEGAASANGPALAGGGPE